MGTKINEMTMTEIVNRAVELGFPMRKAKGEVPTSSFWSTIRNWRMRMTTIRTTRREVKSCRISIRKSPTG